jgi:hypothetical protein
MLDQLSVNNMTIQTESFKDFYVYCLKRRDDIQQARDASEEVSRVQALEKSLEDLHTASEHNNAVLLKHMHDLTGIVKRLSKHGSGLEWDSRDTSDDVAETEELDYHDDHDDDYSDEDDRHDSSYPLSVDAKADYESDEEVPRTDGQSSPAQVLGARMLRAVSFLFGRRADVDDIDEMEGDELSLVRVDSAADVSSADSVDIAPKVERDEDDDEDELVYSPDQTPTNVQEWHDV